MTNMRVFQIQKGKILIVNGDKQYTDTIENFKLDSGLSLDNINEVIYDNYQECCVVNKEFLQYPNDTFDSYINNVDIYIKAKEKREYVPPKEPTLEELKKDKLTEAKQMFVKKRDAIRFIQVDDTNTYGFDCSSDDITNFLAAYTALTNNIIKSSTSTTMYKVWITKKEKAIVALNLEQMNKVFYLVRNSQFKAYEWLNKVEQQIQKAVSKADLDAIVLDLESINL